MYQHAKKNCLYIPSVILQIQKILGCPITRMVTPIFDHAHLKNWPYSFLTMPHQNLFNQLLIFEKHFSQIEDFIIEQIQGKLMTKFFFKFKNPTFVLFLAHFPIFGDKKMFSQKSGITT